MGVEWGGGGTRRPLLRRSRLVRRCTFGCCGGDEQRKYLRHVEEREVSQMLDDYMLDEDWLADRYQTIEDEARYYDVLGFPTHTDSVVVEYDPDEMRRDGDDAHTTARRAGEPTRWDVV